MNGFDIYVKTDPSILKAMSFDLTGTILGANYIEVVHCIDMDGTGCSPYTTGLGVVRVAAVALGYATPVSTTGRLFSIRYNITSLSAGVIGFQTGCSPSSTSVNDCVLVVLGYQIVPVIIDPGISGPGDFLMTSGQDTPLTVPKNTFRFASVTVASINGYYGGIGLSVTVTPKKGPFGLKSDFYISTIGVFLPPGTSTILIVQVSALALTPPGDYSVTITGTSGSLSHAATFIATVPRQ